jgi:ankyrin repeat protein
MGILFFTLVFLGGEAVLREMGAEGIDINATDPSGKTLLMLAVNWAAESKAKRKVLAAIACLLEHGANVSLKDENGETALTQALRRCQKSIAKLLLQYNADPALRIM